MSAVEEARRFGFHISEIWIESLTNPQVESKGETVTEGENNETTQAKAARPQVNLNNFQQLKISLLNSDFRRHPACVSPILPVDLLSSQKSQSLSGPIVLQIVSVQNIAVSAKKRYEDHHSNRFLNLTLTDGHTKVHAVEMETITGLKPNTPPGTKILWKGGEVIKGKLQLTSHNTQFLGGEVLHLVESFQANINALKYRELQQGGTKGVKQLSRIQNPPKFELKLTSLLAAEKSPSIAPAKAVEVKEKTDQKSQPPVTAAAAPEKSQPQQNRRQDGKKKNNSVQGLKIAPPSNPEPILSEIEEVKNDPPKQTNRDNKNHSKKEGRQPPQNQGKKLPEPANEEKKAPSPPQNPGPRENQSHQKDNNPPRQSNNNRQNNRRNPQTIKSDPLPPPPALTAPINPTVVPAPTVVPPPPPSLPAKNERRNPEINTPETNNARKGRNKKSNNRKDEKIEVEENTSNVQLQSHPIPVVTEPLSQARLPESSKPSDDHQQGKSNKSDSRRNQQRRDPSPAPQLIVPAAEVPIKNQQSINLLSDSRNDNKQPKQDRGQRKGNKSQNKDDRAPPVPAPSASLPIEHVEDKPAPVTNNDNNNKRREQRGQKQQKAENRPHPSHTTTHDTHSVPHSPQFAPAPTTATATESTTSLKPEVLPESHGNSSNNRQEQRNRPNKKDGNIVDEMKSLTASLANVGLPSRDDAPARLNTSLAKNMISTSLGLGAKKAANDNSRSNNNTVSKQGSTNSGIVASTAAPVREVKKPEVVVTNVDKDYDYYNDVEDGANPGERGGGGGGGSGGRGRGGRGGRGGRRFYPRGAGRGRAADH